MKTIKRKFHVLIVEEVDYNNHDFKFYDDDRFTDVYAATISHQRFEIDEEVGESVECIVCHQTKAPLGRSVPDVIANSRCDRDCPGYGQNPHVGDLWEGEYRRKFGFNIKPIYPPELKNIYEILEPIIGPFKNEAIDRLEKIVGPLDGDED